MGLKQSSRNHCIYFNVNKNKILIVAAYVDDILMISNDADEKKRLKQELKKRLKQDLKKRFKIKDLGPIKNFLGIRITRDRKNGKLSLD